MDASRLRSVAMIAIFDIAGPLVTYNLLRSAGFSTVAALVLRGDLDDAEYREAVDHVGTAGLFELLTLVGYYATLALQLRVFRVPAPDGTAQPA